MRCFGIKDCFYFVDISKLVFWLCDSHPIEVIVTPAHGTRRFYKNAINLYFFKLAPVYFS